MRIKKEFLITPVILLTLCIGWALAAPSPDAIGVRVAPNPNHYSAQRWYQTQGFKGSPQSLTVDGYEAIRDGRTVYIDVANVVEAAPANNELSIGDQFFTNIFIISYNQDAEKATEDIFGQILTNWKFNNNIASTGVCNSATIYKSDCGDAFGCWPLNVDFKSAKNDGLDGVANNTAINDASAVFNGIDSYVQLGDRAEFAATDKISIVANIYPTGTGTTAYGGEIINKEGRYEVARFADGSIRWAFQNQNVNGGNPVWQWHNTGIMTPLNQWANIVVTYGDNAVKTYLNGNMLHQETFAGSNALSDMLPAMRELRIGSRQTAPQVFPGRISGVKLFNRVLTPGEISSSYSNSCSIDTNCPNNSHCTSAKGVLSRDTRRLADLKELNSLLANYKTKNNGLCPKLESGSYLPNKSVSTWPSWQETLGKALAANLPFDPINKMGTCAGYNDQTCWNEITKQFADPTPLDANFDLPTGSRAYVYLSSPNGQQCSFYVNTESGLTCNGTGLCTIGVNPGTPVPFATASNPGAATNTPPKITAINMPTAIRYSPYQGFIQAEDSDNDNLTWTLTTTGDWSTWVAPTLQVSAANKYQRKLVSSKSGDLGSYSFDIKVDDGHGGIATATSIVRVGNYCDDKDGDGYGVCPNCGKAKGCVNDGNDCDDNPALHSRTGTRGNIDVFGADINLGQVDNCSDYNGLDNNCNGTVGEKASLTTVSGGEVDFEGAHGFGIGAGQAYTGSIILPAENHSPGGASSLLFYQDITPAYAPAEPVLKIGDCNEATCKSMQHYNGNCTWNSVARTCTIPGDACGKTLFNEGESSSCWGGAFDQNNTFGNTQKVFGSLISPGNRYIVSFYYKGRLAPNTVYNYAGQSESSISSLRVIIAGYPGDQSQAYHAKSYPPSRTCRTTYTYGEFVDISEPTGAVSNDCYRHWTQNLPVATPGFNPDNCYCLLHYHSLAAQRAPFGASYGQVFRTGDIPDWTYYSTYMDLASSLGDVKNDDGSSALGLQVQIGYSSIDQAGTKLYIDDLKVEKCVNIP